jgi:hypothetical protein
LVVDAGSFGAWLAAMRAVLRGEKSADVPCGSCTGCCVSSYPIPLRTTDHVALERVPSRYLHLPAGAGSGFARMGFRDDGSCPLLSASGCSIYSDRPQTCRDYDCRIYAAAGLLPDGERPVIRQRVLAWQFGHETAEDQALAAALRRAADFICSHAALFPVAMRAGSATAAAVLAVKTCELFLDPVSAQGVGGSLQQAVRCVIDAASAFDRGKG